MSYTHLNPSERIVIERMKRFGSCAGEIARALGRAPSTILRELGRNSDRSGYDPHWANVLYWKRREQKRLRYKTGDSRLMRRVLDKLQEGWSPEQVCGRFRRHEYAHDPRMWISHETIYRYVWADKRQGGMLWKYLRKKRNKYGKRGTGRHPNQWLRGRVSIDERPKVVTAQGRIGDWEADTIYGRNRESCMVTIIERKSLFTSAAHVPSASAYAVNHAILQSLLHIPKQLIHTLTLDNGKEWADFKELERQLQADVYFTHPYSAWERPVNENLNGLLRQYLPRKSDLRCTTAQQLHEILQRLNDRPRKKHDYRTPLEVFRDACLALDS